MTRDRTPSSHTPDPGTAPDATPNNRALVPIPEEVRKWRKKLGPQFASLLSKLGLLSLTGRRETPKLGKGRL